MYIFIINYSLSITIKLKQVFTSFKRKSNDFTCIPFCSTFLHVSKNLFNDNYY